MKLFYYQAPGGNFGDDLNPWLWPKLLPGFFDEDVSEWFVGIGTLLNHKLPVAGIKHVFGSGYGYGTPPEVHKGDFVFHAVRGPDTARVLGLDPQIAITDAAVLLATIELPPVERVPGRVAYIPHCQSSRYFDWSRVCAELGLTHISMEWDVDTVLTEMRKCELLLCEAMHGAIVADTLRVPWIPVSAYGYIDTFKWSDWLSTLQLSYAPHRLCSLYDTERGLSAQERLKERVKRGLRSMGVWSRHWSTPSPAPTGPAEFEAAVAGLRAARRQAPMLSTDAILERHVNRYLERLQRLRQLGPHGATAAARAHSLP